MEADKKLQKTFTRVRSRSDRSFSRSNHTNMDITESKCSKFYGLSDFLNNFCEVLGVSQYFLFIVARRHNGTIRMQFKLARFLIA